MSRRISKTRKLKDEIKFLKLVIEEMKKSRDEDISYYARQAADAAFEAGARGPR